MASFSPTAIAPEVLHERSVAALARMREMGVSLHEKSFSTGMPVIQYRDLTKGGGDAVCIDDFRGRITPGAGLLASGQSPFHADAAYLTLVRWGKGEDECGRIEIDASVTLSEAAFVSYKSIRVEKGVLFGPGAVVMDCDGVPVDLTKPATPDNLEIAPVTICEGCWIGAYAIIMPGVTIGKYSTVAGGSVVFKDVPPYSLAAGNPASVIGSFRKEDGSPLDP